MKKIRALLCAFAFMAPMLSFAQAAAPATRTELAQQTAHADDDGASPQLKAHYPETGMNYMDRAYGASAGGTMQSGWTTQPSPQALGQSVYVHH